MRGRERGRGQDSGGEGMKVAGAGSNPFLFMWGDRVILSVASVCGGGASVGLCNYHITIRRIKLIKENILHASCGQNKLEA
jgi:hypothetical protein